jgi:hypothetical protein
MTVDERREIIHRYCATGNCDDCKLCHYDTWMHEIDGDIDDAVPCLDIGVATEEELDKALKFIGYKPPVCEGSHSPQEPTVDMVNRPPHYCREGGMECIDEMLILFGKEAVKHFCLCNAWKYRYRSNAKNGEEDLKKSDWYIKKYKELVEG